MLLAKEAGGVFAEEAGVLHSGQYIQVFIGNFLILLLFFQPRINQMTPRPEFAVETASPGRILAANLELASAFHQAVGHPALEGRVVIAEGAGCEVKGVAIRDPVAGIDFAAAGDKGEKQ